MPYRKCCMDTAEDVRADYEGRIKELETKLKGSEERNLILFNGKNKIVSARDSRIKQLETAIENFNTDFNYHGMSSKCANEYYPDLRLGEHYHIFKELLGRD
jgi:hypothetical protein